MPAEHRPLRQKSPPPHPKPVPRARRRRGPNEREEREISSSGLDTDERDTPPPTRQPVYSDSQVNRILSGEPPRDIFREQESEEGDWLAATITLGSDSEAELDAIFAEGIDTTDSLDVPVPSDLIGLLPLELVVPANDTPMTVNCHIEEGVLPQLVVEMNARHDQSPTRRVESESVVKPPARRWLTDTQPPLLPDISQLPEVEKLYFLQLEEEMRCSAVRHRRHVYQAAMESDRMREIRATVQGRYATLTNDVDRI